MWNRYTLQENPHTRGCSVVSRLGDVNPIEYGGGFLFLCKVSGQSNYVIEYAEEEEEVVKNRVLYQVHVPDDVFEWNNWADVNAIAASYDADPAELRRAGASSDPRERAYALESIAGHYGWHELDHEPRTMTASELRKRWARALRSR